MDTPPISTAADPGDPATSKLRLMCSYGGSIVPRPHNKSLCYAGGDTRIVAVDRRTTAASFSSLTAHLSHTLYNNRSFLLKYQLPDEDLDALVSVATDEDLQNMIDEHDRIVSSPRTSRIRLFLFPSKPESVGSALIDSKSESWFCDALKSTKIMQRRQSADSGLVNGLMGLDSDSCVEAQIESLSNEVKHGLDLGSVSESMVLETSSSFGSTSSSISMSNLPPIGAHGDDGGLNVQEKKAKVVSPGSMESENSSASARSHPQTSIFQDPVVHVPSMETRDFSSAVDAGSFACDPASGIQMLKNMQLPVHQVSLQSDQIQHQQHMPYIQAGTHYIPQYSVGQFPISFHPMYYSPMHQQTQNPYQPNPPYPVYLLPVRPPQSYNTSMQYNLLDTETTALSMAPMHPSTTTVTPPVAYKEFLAAAPLPELATKVYRTVAGATPLIEVPSDQNQPPLVDLSEIHHPSQSVATASIAAANYDNEYEDDLAYTQIYKTQPSVPALLSQYQTMTGAGLVLSEASKLPHVDTVKQHIGPSQPQ
ncbi:Hyphal wall protein [Actinidia chinensis var. chinensis]|uniref:Hyphal wall protein n=1 Tax=Actinidia chinensis var. chinensis TaxID=1590841 RepID=A0A2R6RKP7_ACTCC|nr:Hyphal wall protein [Actinidia chinensis var. chinensis]